MTIRPLTLDDLPQLPNLFAYNDPAAALAENARDMQAGVLDIIGLFTSEGLMGELHIKYRSDDPREAQPGSRAYLFAYRIHERLQGRGCGKRLLQWTLDDLARRGYTQVTIGVEDDNPRARHIYAAHGFNRVIARKAETYQGDGYEYDLLLRIQKELR